MLLVIGLMAWGMFVQLVNGDPWGTSPASDLVLAIVGVSVIALCLLILYGLYALTLVVAVTDSDITVRMVPLLNRSIALADVVKCELVDYNSIKEYGGWGIRWAPGKGWAYIVSGHEGVKLELSRGKKVMIGTQRAEELARAINENLPSARSDFAD
jgi:hypothetical protein